MTGDEKGSLGRPEQWEPLVSVIVNCYNGEAYLGEALESVAGQTYRNWEVVFWDNASTDRSGEIARSFGPKVKYHRAQQTIPLGAARNRALSEAHGDLIAFLDADDLWEPEKLELQVPLFRNPEVGLVYCDVTSFNDRGEQRAVSDRKTYFRGSRFPELLAEYPLYMSSVVLRREALERGGLQFNERFEMVEEADLFLRVAYDWHIDYVPEVLAHWRVHAGSGVWSRYELMASETEEMMELFDESMPGFRDRYPDAVRVKEVWISRTRALSQWRDGDAAAARRTIRERGATSLHLMVLWWLTFLPAGLILPLLYRLKGTVVYPAGDQEQVG